MKFKQWFEGLQPKIDLRKDYDEMLPVEGGTYYRKGKILQVWWIADSRGNPFPQPEGETWNFPDEQQAIDAMERERQWGMREGRTYRDQQYTKTVYHWDTESNFNKVLLKQGRGMDKIQALWVSPNADWNDHWATWMVRANEYPEGKKTFYLHKIAIPHDLYVKYANRERSGWDTAFPGRGSGMQEFVITQEDWPQLQPLSVKAYSRQELLGQSFAHQQRRAMHAKEPLLPGPAKNDPKYQQLLQMDRDAGYTRQKPRPKAWWNQE